ncbi:acyltransferase family protein [Massilia sp. BHUDP2]|uniref:acyltransferase family protein n=1 Tax=Massilia sp. BHUDP2 TaxID=3034505 RepID=UPI0039060586
MTERSPNLDLLRTMAVMFVVSSHLLLDNFPPLVGWFHLQSLGTLGVMIFFVHTCLVLLQSIERHTVINGAPPSALSFLVARAFRIYPMSIVVVVTLAMLERIATGTQPSLSTFLSNVFLIQNLTGDSNITPVLWSLPFELQMYLFLPALYSVASVPLWRSARTVALLWCASLGLIALFLLLGWNTDLIKFFPCFLPGVLAYTLRGAPKTWGSLLLFGYVGTLAFVYPLLVGMGLSATVLAWISCLSLGLLIPRCVQLESRWLQSCSSTIARYSYGIYLVHVPVMHLCFDYFGGLPGYLSWLSFFAGVAGLSYLGYHLIEKPGIEFGHALMRRMNARVSGTMRQLH